MCVLHMFGVHIHTCMCMSTYMCAYIHVHAHSYYTQKKCVRKSGILAYLSSKRKEQDHKVFASYGEVTGNKGTRSLRCMKTP